MGGIIELKFFFLFNVFIVYQMFAAEYFAHVNPQHLKVIMVLYIHSPADMFLHKHINIIL